MSLAESEVGDTYMLSDRRDRYIACEELDYTWSLKDVHQVETWWRKGVSLTDMSHELNREPEEVFILLMDRIRNNKIHERYGGVFGGIPEPEESKDALTEEVYLMERKRGISKRAIAKKYGISRPGLKYRIEQWRCEE